METRIRSNLDISLFNKLPKDLKPFSELEEQSRKLEERALQKFSFSEFSGMKLFGDMK